MTLVAFSALSAIALPLFLLGFFQWFALFERGLQLAAASFFLSSLVSHLSIPFKI
jgi:hypothetical protein